MPLYTLPTSPEEQSTVTGSPLQRIFVALPVPTIQGMPSSRETMAAWDVRPPLSVIIAPAIFIIGSQSGSVISVTNTSSFLKEEMFLALFKMRAAPAPIFPADGDTVRQNLAFFVACILSTHFCPWMNARFLDAPAR